MKSTELTKEALDLLLPQLDFSAQEIMSRQLLSENPEMPDSIFSITEADTTESMDPSEQLNNTADQSEMVLLGEEKSEKISCSDTAEDGPEHGPLLLQHLQGTYEYSHSRSSSKNSEAAASQSSVSTETASESAMERKDFTDNEEDNKLAEMTDVC